MPSIETATEKKSRSPRTPRTILTPVPIKDGEGNVIGTVTIPVYPDGMTNREGIAAYLGIGLRTVDAWVAGKRIPFQRRGSRMLRFSLRDVATALRKLTVRETI
jgi:excisionase family DNA binding protein